MTALLVLQCLAWPYAISDEDGYLKVGQQECHVSAPMPRPSCRPRGVREYKSPYGDCTCNPRGEGCDLG